MKTREYVAKTLQGLENVLAEEITSLGGTEIEIGNRYVSFSADKRVLYRINYRVSTAIRILESFKKFTFDDITEFYEQIKNNKWDIIIQPNQTIAVDASVFNSNPFNNSHFAELKAKDAIVDYFRENFGTRPGVDKDNPAMLVNIFIHGNFCHVSLDTSGTPLYKRRYRELLHEASINEVLAAGMIRLSGWDGKGYFYDPMCGSGTIAIEAAMFAQKIPAGFYREDWGFMNWKSFEPLLWDEILAEKTEVVDPNDFKIIASDISAQSQRMARKNIAKARMLRTITLKQCSFDSLKPESEKGILIFNPPYNVRLPLEDIIDFYKSIGNHLKHNFKGHDAWIISSDVTAIKNIGLKASKKYMLFNGPLEARYHKFSSY